VAAARKRQGGRYDDESADDESVHADRREQPAYQPRARCFRVGDVKHAFVDPSRACSFCLREIASVEHLVKALEVSICDACVARYVKELEARRAKGRRRWWHAFWPRRRPACSFCRDRGVDDTIVAEHARICPPCVRLALDILREHAAGARILRPSDSSL
jgi:hypothetical protein